MGISIQKTIWKNVLEALKIPHYSHTKRVGLSNQHYIPIILGVGIIPILSHVQIEFGVSQPTNTKRIYYDICLECFQEEMIYDTKQDVQVCTYCGNTCNPNTIWNHTRESRKILRCRTYNPEFYKRISHFRDWLNRLQGKERHKVSTKVIDDVKTLLQHENTKGVSFWTIKNALRRLKYSRHYCNTVYIMSQIRGYPVFVMTPSQQDELVKMFISLSDVYENVLRNHTNIRVNMLSYPYMIRKLCELKDWDHVSKVIPFLKSHSSIINQDQIWALVCRQKKWKFIPTRPWSDIDHRSADHKPQ